MDKQHKYMVCIHCMTYNHRPYILDALHGFTMQQTDFPFVAIVMDDASTDGEQDVINQYLEQNFDLSEMSIESVPNAEIDNHAWRSDAEEGVYTFAQHKTNKNCYILSINLKKNLYKVGGKGRFTQSWRTSAKYVAMCEGDDYWTDPYKLQKQVEILGKDETLMACCTNCSVVDMQGKTLEEQRKRWVVKDNQQGRYNLRDFFNQGHQYPTLSVVYRNVHTDEVRKKCEIMRNPYMGDWTLWIALLCFGNMYYLDEITCSYRINPTSLTHDQSKSKERRIGLAKENFRLIPAVASVLPDGYQDIKNDLLYNTAWRWYDLAHAYWKYSQFGNMIYALLRYMIAKVTNPIVLYLHR